MPADVPRTAKILIVDDEESSVRLLERFLRRAGYIDLKSTTDSRLALALYAAFQPDLVLLDLRMPHRDGFQILEELQLAIPEGSYVPVLVLTADVTSASLRRALLAGARDYLTKPFDAHEVALRIGNLLQTRFLHLALQHQNQVLEEQVRQRTHQLLQMEKLSAMGHLLAGVAHELNNPLAVVSGQAQLLQSGPVDPAYRARAEKIAKATDRCVRIVRNFLALARERPPERAVVDLNTVVREAVELLSYELRADHVDVRWSLVGDLPRLWADPHQLHQVVVNLVTNAHHALRQTPTPRVLSITTRSTADPPRVQLTVSDNGPGIPADIQERIFDAFFTTKPPGQGTGLGLSLSRGIVEDHGGTVRVASAAGQGTTFVIELPLGLAESPPSRAAPAHEVVTVSIQQVLIVDDEADVAEVLVDLLQTEGHEVDTARNGAEALSKLQQRSYDLILSDTKMPVLDGLEFFQELGRQFPEMRQRIAFVTGDVLSPDKRAFLERTGAPILAKPFDLAEIQALVRRLPRRPNLGVGL